MELATRRASSGKACAQNALHQEKMHVVGAWTQARIQRHRQAAAKQVERDVKVVQTEIKSDKQFLGEQFLGEAVFGKQLFWAQAGTLT
jgi:hypothetical protein